MQMLLLPYVGSNNSYGIQYVLVDTVTVNPIVRYSLTETVPYFVCQQGDWRTRASEGAAPQHVEQALGEAANGGGLFSG
jgi:hypothetical protein